MADANELCDTIMWQLNNVAKSDTDETKEEPECFSFQEETDIDDIPPALLSYFENSKSRAAIFEKLILEEPAEDMMSVPIELDKDMMKLNGQIVCDNEENNTSTDTRLLPAPTETETLSTHNVSVCPNNEDEAGRDEYMESERHLTLEVRTLEISLIEEERQEIGEYEAEREKRHCEEIDKEEQKRQIERDFQKELKRLMEAEKLHQMELELMEKRAQEKLEQELLLQQEVICNLRRRVEEERKLREEEQKRIKDEKEKRKQEEEKIKMEAERKRTEEETRRKKEEERKIAEMKLKKEEEEEKKRRKREEERNKIDLEKKKLEDKMRMMRDEEERMRKEEKKRKEKIKMIEEARKKVEEERRNEEEMNLRKEEEWRTDAEERKKKESIRLKEEGRITDETEERKKQEEMRKMKEKKDIDDRKKMVQKKMYVETMRDKDEEIELEERNKKEENDGKGKEEEEEAWKREKERKKTEEEKEVKQVVRKREGENRKMKEQRPMEEDEKRNQEDGRQIKEEERRRRQREEMRKLRDEEDYRKSEDKKKEGCTGYDVDNKTNDKEKKGEEEEEERKLGKEEMRKMEEERKNVEAEREQNGEKVGENKRQVNKKTEEEEIRLKEKGESKKRMMQNREVEGRGNWLQEKTEENSTIGQKEKNKMDKRENSLTSQLEDSTIWTSSIPGPFHSESTICPTSADAITQQCDTDKSISQTSTHKTVDCESQAGRPSSVSVSLPVCLPEHTEHKRLSWMKDCISWSRLSLQNRRKQKGSVRRRRGPRRAAEASRLPPLCPDSLLRSTCWKSPQEVTTVTLEDLPGCSLSTLAQCTQLRSLTLRRCGLKSLEGINQLPQLCYINAQENDISFVDCENMTSLRVLQLSHNKLTSIHGLTGAENLDVLHLSHNSITRIAGLESTRRLQRLSVDHNQLISTKGLRDVYTLLHLNCSYNHLASVEGLENSALLNTLDLRANSLTEPPSLNNQVLLRELHLDDNSISSLQGLAACWLPLMLHLSVAQNRITQLPSMADVVSLANLDLRFNCLSELQSVCESLRECQFLRELHLTGNPLQQESGWRSTLHRAVPGLRAVDEQEADSLLLPPAVQQVSLASGSFLTFCQAQLQQTHDLQQQHSREFSKASSSLDAVETSCRHFTEALQLAEDQRFSHEYGETTVADKHSAAGRKSEETPDMDRTNVVKCTQSTGQVSPLIPNKDNIRCSHRTFDEKTAAESWHDTFDTVTTGPQTGPAISKANSGSVHYLPKGNETLEMATVSNHQDLDLQNTAAVMIQQLWRKHKQRCGNISHPSTAEKGGGDGRNPESGPSYINESVVGQDYAATVIQAFWRGFTLRRRLASALAAVTCTDTGEDDTFEEVDVDEFVFDETLLEKPWTFPFPEDSPPRCYSVSEQPLSLKVFQPRGPSPDPSQYILPPQMLWRSKQAWVAGEQVDSAGQTVSPVSSNRSKSPPSTSVLSGLSRRSEKIVEEWGFTHSHTALLMLKRAQNMKSRKQQQKKLLDPSVRLDLFRNRSYQPGPVEAWNGQAQHNRNYIKACEAELGPQQAEKTERVKQERAQQWLHTQASHSDRDSASLHFLPEISSDILNGGRVQLVADPGYTERLHHASGLWANSSLAAQPCKENNYPRRNSLGHARKEVPSPQRVTSAPSKKERISFRDNPVQLSGGWGGGKKRDKVHK
ncbi:leucine-rich repeat- and IQ domain-containing protein 1 [Pempheris klunzingeri]|uniref:leucine-rich repeat- and IQ domain-containing protein 1 n=1 Tax=Pempheris klunzingeri TaxID=3127111 RepID=UPI00397FC559